MRKSVENLATSKTTGGRRHPLRIRRKYETDRYPNEAVTGAQVTVTRAVRGKNRKTAVKTIDFVNLATGDAKVKKTKILKVLDNATNNDYKRRGIITKGAILETQEGKCRVVSKPGQNGIVNAVLVKE
ncbi:30S ribosomal protein S8e [Marine Group I thaumarchaeote SCGC AAA799-E16]|uniref:Small ribosomal subunit protein eS8 n=6 Tax=Marine Group I TaxID=905826 RepID=A0A087S7J2_9ARCH|nr:30S ribosomal protein S8e [Marine Group I thaumarchaeote SCGC AAA799-N04]KER06979.1 30S ribosomal protein S8e [Marine Group I thaumarchaeote SCGC AAA799-E16]KFM16915.1 30S ribosomal protein S8e [Marine Group I thaumarchaeote SCGC AAA799-D11]KFM18606.1 30S ribosomal protein S8e [Marine Group I thaumarchaeote SCGC RSA3]KFM19873.1 30S ribosomal protein S8e [Marine Group I thaumarchaeote SCGC AAA799-P11]KFM21696.1 30S ribosomal protein S8e [Marine Group I thaumarchaeote SCGC AAA799-B03]